MSTTKSESLEFVVAPKTYYVYTYSYPDGNIFYIGKGLQGRIDRHEEEATKGCECKRCLIIREIWRSGKPVQKRIVYETFDEIEAFTYEHNLIKQHAGPYLTHIAGNTSNPSFNPEKKRRARRKSVSKSDLSKDIIGMQEARLLLGNVSSHSIVKLVRENEIRGHKAGGDWHFHRADILEYIQRQIQAARVKKTPQ